MDYKRKYCFFLLLLFVAFSCEDILDLQPLGAISESNVWSDPDLIELYVNSRYDELPHGFVQWAGGLRVTSITDESYHIHQGSRLTNKYTQGELNPSNMHLFGGFWKDAYEAIRNLNIYIENIDPLVGNPERINQLTAEIRFLRAWFYTELFSRYGDVPLITSSISISEADEVKPRASVGEIINFINSELVIAAEDLPIDQVGDDFGRVTKGAALALRARALLYAVSPLFNETVEFDWSDVALACEELFALNNYSLSSDYQGMFLNVNDPEVIFFKQFLNSIPWQSVGKGDAYYHPQGGHNIEQYRLPNGSGGWTAENPLMNLIDKYETIDGQIPVLGYSGSSDNLEPQINPNANLYDPENPYANRDPRLAYSVIYDGSVVNGREIEFWECGEDSRCDDVDGWWNGALIDHTIRKSLDLSWQPGTGLNSQTPWIYMRLAEFYLTYAEAQYHLGNFGLAAEYVNRVRNRPGVEMPSIETSQTGYDLLEKIKHERAVELAFEGNRWYDSRRWLDAEEDFGADAIGLEVIKDMQTGEKSFRYFIQQNRSFPQSHYLFPIPVEEMIKTSWTQNPGY